MTQVGITGATGYLGGMLTRRLASQGEVRALSRTEFDLGSYPNENCLRGIEILFHFAWDLHDPSPSRRAERNIEGSLALLEVAKRVGVKAFVFISSLAAFPGCTTENGEAKLRVERAVLDAGGIVLRPGMVLDDQAGGIFGSLVALSSAWGVKPYPIPDPRVWVVHLDDLQNVCETIVRHPGPFKGQILEVAYPQPISFSQVCEFAAQLSGRWCLPFPTPLRPMLAVASVLEKFGLPNRAESLRALLKQRSSPLDSGGIEIPDPRKRLSEKLRVQRFLAERRNTLEIHELKPNTWFWSSPAATLRAKRRAELLFQDCISGDTLECGPGSGVFSRIFREQFGRELITVDLWDRRQIADSGVQEVCGDIVRLPFRSSSFDFVFGSSILHHAPLEEALAEVHRVLRPGGRFAFAEPNLLNPQIFLQKLLPALKRKACDVEHEGAYLRWTLRRILLAQGFQDVQVTPFDFVHPSLPPALGSLLDRLGRVLERTPVVREIAGSLLITGRKESGK